MRILVGLIIATFLTTATAAPIRAVVEKIDKTRLSGQITEFDIDGFVLVNDRDETHEVRWDELAAKNAFALYARLIEKDNNADRWLELGAMLQEMPDGATWAEKAYARALKIDPELKDRVAELKDSDKDRQNDDSAGPDVQAESAAEPQTVGPVEEKFWGKLSDDEMKSAVARLIEFGDETREKINGDLQLLETNFFLFYSDLPKDEARKWAGLLDKMYARLCELFAIPKETNIWRGKCLIFVFRQRGDYVKFQRDMHQNETTPDSIGACYNFGDGTVHITLHSPQGANIAGTLVHESVHGFLHRYRTPVSLPSWVNEGLAEVIESELVASGSDPTYRKAAARDEIESNGGLDGDFFLAAHIRSEHYTVARTMCEMMIRENKKGYVAFINGIKDGLEWEESLKQKYGVDKDRLVNYYYDWLGVQRKRMEQN